MKHIIRFILCFSLIMAAPAMSAEFPKIAGWTPEGDVKTFYSDNLWEYINGAADQFLAFGFSELRYQDFSKDGVVVTVHLYDMGSRLNAFGIYDTERPDDSRRRKIGAEAVILPPYQCLMLKGDIYVKVDAYEGEITEDVGKQILTALAASLTGSDDLPDELTRLPKKNQKEGSEGYIRSNYLGLSELQNCVFAHYEDGDNTYQHFIMLTKEKLSAQALKDKLGSRWGQMTLDGHPVFYREVPYKGLVGLVITDTGIYGVSDNKNRNEFFDRLRLVF